MQGFPLLREAAWLYRGDDAVPSALLRLYERREGGWLVVLVEPLGHDEERQEMSFDDEAQARETLDRVYTQGEAEGRWSVRRHDRPAGVW